MQAGRSVARLQGRAAAVLTRRVHVVAAGGERGRGRGLWLRLRHDSRAVAVHGQSLAGPRRRLVPVERRARRGAGTARVKRRRSVESAAAAVASDATAAQVYRQCLLQKQTTSFSQADTLQTLKAKSRSNITFKKMKINTSTSNWDPNSKF